ncbi:unnamed protein product [Bursaphelenchus okinawaensis]|uniref:TOG domain-containing protein n=1 Tax=Bursaphelenchus okinawaensis TaxID=465554 RepID=A0A811LL68_9BILA|nr:unnamed protein product [Bursaphelenchus okinawaensis]CAG9126081.1 unnamed protein product [Bursaphelenchus okinawaensis]
MDFFAPYDLTKDINDSFYEQLQSKKWLERKEPMDKLIGIIDKNPKLQPNDSEYHRLVDEIVKILSKDNNINVTASAAQFLTRLARGLGKNFEVHAGSVVNACLIRMKEVKPVVKEPCSECLDACYEITTFGNVVEPIKDALVSKAPGTKLASCDFFKRCMLKIDLQTAKKSAAATKEAVDHLCKMALGSDAMCRDAAMQALAAFMRAVGQQASLPLLSSVQGDKLKMAKVEEYYEQFVQEYPPVSAAAAKASEKEAAKPGGKPKAKPIEVVEEPISESNSRSSDATMFLTPYDLTKDISDSFYEELQSKKWLERKEPMDKLIGIIDKNPKLQPNDSEYHRLIDEIVKILSKDNNINVTASAAQLLTRLARGLGKNFEVHAGTVVNACLIRMKEVKPVVKEPCSECLDACYETTTFGNVVEPVKDALVSKAPGTKVAACDFFKRCMLKIDLQTAKKSAAATKEAVDHLCKMALGSDAMCRDAAMQALAAFMRAVGQQASLPLLSSIQGDKLKMAKVEEYYEQFVQEYPTVTSAAAAPAAKAPEKKVVRPGQKPPKAAKTVEAEPIPESRTRTPTPEASREVEESYRPEPAFVETPMVRQSRMAVCQKSEELTDYLNKCAGVPLESFLNLSYKPSSSTLTIKERLDNVQLEKDKSDPKFVLLDALKALNSTDLIVANGGVVDLFGLAQDAIDARLLTPKTEGIIDALGLRLSECAELLDSDPSPTQEKNVEDFLKNASNLLLRFIPQKDIAGNIDFELCNKLLKPLFELWFSENVKSDGKSSIKHVVFQIAESISPNVTLVWLARELLPIVKEAVEVEKETKETDYKQTKPGNQMALMLTTANKAVEVVRGSNVPKKMDLTLIFKSLAPLVEFIVDKSLVSPQSPIKNSIVGMVQRLVQPLMEKAIAAAVQLSMDFPTFSNYVIKCVNAFFNRRVEEFAKKGEQQYVLKLVWLSLEKFKKGDTYEQALDSLYLVYKLMDHDDSFKKTYKADWDECMKHSIFDTVATDMIQKYELALKAHQEFDIHEYVFDTYTEDSTKELYQRVKALCEKLRSSPSIFTDNGLTTGSSNGGDTVKSNFLKDMRRYSSLNKTVTDDNNENTLILFKDGAKATPRREDQNMEHLQADFTKTITKKRRDDANNPTVQLQRQTLDFVTKNN